VPATQRSRAPVHTIVGVLVLLLALVWLPGQSQASATRWWVATAILPLGLLGLPLHRLGRRAWWLVPWGLLALSALAGAAWVRDPGAALHTGLTQISWVAALAMGLVVGADTDSRRWWPCWLAAAGTVAAVPGIVEPGGTLGNPSLLAGLLVGTTLWSGLSLKDVESSRWPVKGGLLLSMALQLAALLRCGSLGAWLALACGTLTWAVIVTTRTPRSRAAALGILVLLLVSVALMVTRVEGVQAHLDGRAHMARCSLDVVRGSLPGGVGAGQFHGAFLEAQASDLQQRPDDRRFWSNADHAHNEALHVLAERGPTGALLLWVPLLAALLRIRDPVAWAVVLGMSVFSQVSLPMYEPVTWVVTAATVGVVLGRGRGTDESRAARSFSRRWSTVVILVAGLLCALLASSELLGDRLLVRGVEESDDALLATSARLSLRQARPLQHRAALLISTDPALAETLALEAVARDPSTRGWLVAGDAAMHIPDPDGAIPHYREAVRLNPRLFAGHFNLARAYEEAGDRQSARRHAERARSLRPSDPRLDWLPR